MKNLTKNIFSALLLLTTLVTANAANTNHPNQPAGFAGTTVNAIHSAVRIVGSVVPKVSTGHFSVDFNKYGCQGSSFGCTTVCNMLGHAEYLINNRVRHFFCAACIEQLNIRDGAELEAPVQPLVARGTKAIVKIADQVIRVEGGSIAFLQELIHSGRLAVVQIPLGPIDAFKDGIKTLMGNGIFNEFRAGVSRGSPHFVTHRGQWNGRVSESLVEAIPAFKKVFEIIGSRLGGILSAWLTFYLGLKFKEHRDKRYRGKPVGRGILNMNEREGYMKRMRIIDRVFGRYVDLACEHGTFIWMDLVISGTIDPRFTHAVFDALFNINITMETGEKADWNTMG